MTTTRPSALRRIATTLALGGLGVALAACSGNSGGSTVTRSVAGQAAAAGQDAGSSAAGSTSAEAKPDAVVTASPKFDADDISPTAPVSITVAAGRSRGAAGPRAARRGGRTRMRRPPTSGAPPLLNRQPARL